MSKNMQGFGMMIQKLKASPKRIVFTEGTDERILEAASRLLASNFLTPILVGKEDEVQAAAEEYGYNIRGAQIIDPENFDRMDEMIAMFCELRKSKNIQPDEARKILSAGNYFGTMLVKMGVADALLGGATYSTADTVRPALQLIKTKPGSKIVSSCFIMVRPSATGENEVLAMGDCAINIKPTAEELVEIAIESAECGRISVSIRRLLSLATQHWVQVKVKMLTRCVQQLLWRKKKRLAFQSKVNYSLMLPFLHVLLVQNAQATQLLVMRTYLYSLTSTLVTSVTRLLSVLVTSMHTAQSC